MARFVMSSRRGSPGVSCVGVGRDARRRAAPSGNFPAIDRYRACWVTVTDEKKAWEKKRRGAGDGDADDVVPGRGERGCAARLRPGSSPLPVGCSTTCSPAIAAGGGERSGHRSVNRFQPVGGKTSPPVPHAHGRIRLPEGRPAGRRVAGRDATSARVSRSSYRVGALVKEVKERSGPGLTFGTVASSADLSSSPRASSRDGDDDGGGFLGDGVCLDRAGASSSAASSSTPSGNRPSGRSPRSSSSPSRGAPAAEEVMPAGGQSSGNKLTVSPFFFPFRSGGWGGCRAATRVSDPRPGATPRRVDA